jgi:hypothetical protein
MTINEQIKVHLEHLFAAASEREREYHRDCISWLAEPQSAAKPANAKPKWQQIWRLVGFWL